MLFISVTTWAHVFVVLRSIFLSSGLLWLHRHPRARVYLGVLAGIASRS